MTPHQNWRRATELAEDADKANPASPEANYLLQRAQLHAMLAVLDVIREVDRRLNPIDPATLPEPGEIRTVRAV